MAAHAGIKDRAKQAVQHQGHTMGAWRESGNVQPGYLFLIAECIKCGRHVWVNTATHEIEGSATREICKPR